MTNLPIGTVVRNGSGKKAVFGVVRNRPTETATGLMVTIQYLPDFTNTTATGWSDYAVADLTEVRVCACAHLAYRPQHGDQKGELFTTGCDYSRMPGRASKFLPGHDAKAKGFLIRASGLTSQMENGKTALETARDLGDKISMAVAKGMDNERRKLQEKAMSKRHGAQVNRPAQAATPENLMTPAQKLQAELKVTPAMMESLAYALTQHDGMITRTTTGTTVAMQTRKLVSWGDVTYLGRQVMDFPVLETDKVQCTDAEGTYARHTGYTIACKRCGVTPAEEA